MFHCENLLKELDAVPLLIKFPHSLQSADIDTGLEWKMVTFSAYTVEMLHCDCAWFRYSFTIVL